MGTMNKKQRKTANSVAVPSSDCVGTRKRIQHRLEKRADLLTPVEIDFLMSMYDRLAFSNTMSEKQCFWLMAILERTATKNLKTAKSGPGHQTDRI
jgi:hypothetical protein